MNDTERQAALATRLRALSRDEPDLTSDVRTAQRARLVAMAAVRPVGAAAAVRTPRARPSRWQRLLAGRPVDPVGRWRTRVTAGLIGAAVSVGALSGLVAVAQGAEPGDLLYGLKRGSEQTQLALASDAERGLTLLQFASVRLAELAELTGSDVGASPGAVGGVDASGLAVAASGADADTVVGVLTTMDRQTVEGTSALTTTAVPGRDQGALTTLAGWTTGQQAGLDALDVPAGAESAVAASAALVAEVAARAAALQAALACPAGAADPGTDRLGVVPGQCLAGTPTSSAAPSADPGATPAPGATTGQTPTTGAPATGAPATSVPVTGAPGGPPTAAPGPTGGGAAPATQAPGPAPAPAPAPAPGAGPVQAPAPAPTGAAVPTTTVSPPVRVPLPVPSTTICVGGLICVGG